MEGRGFTHARFVIIHQFDYPHHRIPDDRDIARVFEACAVQPGPRRSSINSSVIDPGWIGMILEEELLSQEGR